MLPAMQRERHGKAPRTRTVTDRRLRGRGDHCAVGPVASWGGDLTAHDGDLMPEHQDLRILRGIAPRE